MDIVESWFSLARSLARSLAKLAAEWLRKLGMDLLNPGSHCLLKSICVHMLRVFKSMYSHVLDGLMPDAKTHEKK